MDKIDHFFFFLILGMNQFTSTEEAVFCVKGGERTHLKTFGAALDKRADPGTL